MLPRVEQVMRQTKARVLGGDTRAPGKLVSLFEPTTEIIRKGKAGKPTEFGKLVKIQEAEHQNITDYAVYAQRPSDSALLAPAIQGHQDRLGRVRRKVAATSSSVALRVAASARPAFKGAGDDEAHLLLTAAHELGERLDDDLDVLLGGDAAEGRGACARRRRCRSERGNARCRHARIGRP
jgi:hypothetical protein